jgi:hypothetical protein
MKMEGWLLSSMFKKYGYFKTFLLCFVGTSLIIFLHRFFYYLAGKGKVSDMAFLINVGTGLATSAIVFLIGFFVFMRNLPTDVNTQITKEMTQVITAIITAINSSENEVSGLLNPSNAQLSSEHDRYYKAVSKDLANVNLDTRRLIEYQVAESTRREEGRTAMTKDQQQITDSINKLSMFQMTMETLVLQNNELRDENQALKTEIAEYKQTLKQTTQTKTPKKTQDKTQIDDEWEQEY